MSEKKSVGAFCIFCFLTGVVAPWGFLVVGGLIGVVGSSDYINETGAWFSAIGIVLLGISYFWARFLDAFDRRG